jgi:acyl-CoA reductase-like NAD-dependent aldehyde dehydrogenase
VVDGSFGEVLTTCEKLVWTITHGEACLKPEYRSVGALMMHKHARVEYVPLGVLGAIIPWNYPFHNMLGQVCASMCPYKAANNHTQVISALFAGNAIALKVSEHACWCGVSRCVMWLTSIGRPSTLAALSRRR